MVPIRKRITEQRFVAPTLDLSQKKDKEEPHDRAKPYKTMYKVLSEILVLLGPPPPPEDAEGSLWHSEISTTIQVALGEALNELALIEKARAAPNLSKERAQAIVLASWPNWDQIVISLLDAQDKAATASALVRSFTNAPPAASPTTPHTTPAPAGRGGIKP